MTRELGLPRLYGDSQALDPAGAVDLVTAWPLLDSETHVWLRGTVRNELADHH